MPEVVKSSIQVFNRDEHFDVTQRRLPHWSQAGTVAFITWRTWDSIPKHILEDWLAERKAWLEQRGIRPDADDWQKQLAGLGPRAIQDYQRQITDRWDENLDECHGARVLKRPVIATIVSDSLLHFNGEKYDLTDFVVMPNHVHILAVFPTESSMLAQCDSWKHFTATQINRALNRKGRFWQQDGFDHLVRSVEQFDYLRQYIANNPARARLAQHEYIHWSKPM